MVWPQKLQPPIVPGPPPGFRNPDIPMLQKKQKYTVQKEERKAAAGAVPWKDR